jgi:hypothetical protein
MNTKAFKKWLCWVFMIVVGTWIGGDFGLLAALVLIYLTAK